MLNQKSKKMKQKLYNEVTIGNVKRGNLEYGKDETIRTVSISDEDARNLNVKDDVKVRKTKFVLSDEWKKGEAKRKKDSEKNNPVAKLKAKDAEITELKKQLAELPKAKEEAKKEPKEEAKEEVKEEAEATK